MQELQLVGVDEDGEHVLLQGPDGQRFRLSIDEPLRAAVRRDRARLGQLQISVQGKLRPREIQARIRAGETAEDIALSADVPVEHVRRYEGPVLAERAHVVERAGGQVVRTSGPDRGTELAALVAARLAARGVNEGTWDAWRREDGAWTVQVEFRAGSKDRRARWSYDLASGVLEPVDDESRWLSAAQPPPEDEPVPGRRLSAVREKVYDVEADGGVREAQRPAARRRPEERTQAGRGEQGGESVTAELLEELRGRRGRRQPVLTATELAQLDGEGAPPGAEPGVPFDAVDAEILALPEAPEASGEEPSEASSRAGDEETPREGESGAPEKPAAAAAMPSPEDDRDVAAEASAPRPDGDAETPHEAGRSGSEPEPASDAPAPEPPASAAEPASVEPDAELTAVGAARQEKPAGGRQPASKPPRPRGGRRGGTKGKPGRASVPSWDEIVFGAKKE
ncbi:MAG: septation protein SepH [Actinomycetes bacterium]